MNRIFRLGIAVVAALSLAGCGILFPTARDRAAKNTPGFKDGFTDGCAAANAQDTKYRNEMIRDEEAYQTDKDYRAGWASGFHNCRTNLAHDPAAPGVGPIPDVNPGSHRY